MATKDLTVWIGGPQAEMVVKAISVVQRRTDDKFDQRLTPRVLIGHSATGNRILTFVGPHPSAPLYGGNFNAFKQFLTALMLALATCLGTTQHQIDEELVELARAEEERAKIVEGIIASRGLVLDTLRQQQRAGVRHLDPDALRSSLLFVDHVVEVLVKYGLMSEKDSKDPMGIFDVASRLSVMRSADVKVPDLEQVTGACAVLHRAGAQNLFSEVTVLNDVLCFHIEQTPRILLEVCEWVAADSSRLEIISGSASWGAGLYQLLLVARRHGIYVLDSISSLVKETTNSHYSSVVAMLPMWRLLFKTHFKESSSVQLAIKRSLECFKLYVSSLAKCGTLLQLVDYLLPYCYNVLDNLNKVKHHISFKFCTV